MSRHGYGCVRGWCAWGGLVAGQPIAIHLGETAEEVGGLVAASRYSLVAIGNMTTLHHRGRLLLAHGHRQGTLRNGAVAVDRPVAADSSDAGIPFVDKLSTLDIALQTLG